VKNIYKRLFRVYAHIFHTHFGEVEARGAEAHLNRSFKHLMYFILEFDLVEEADLVPLKSLIKILTSQQVNETAAD
jgi:MOB kinase activator 1